MVSFAVLLFKDFVLLLRLQENNVQLIIVSNKTFNLEFIKIILIIFLI